MGKRRIGGDTWGDLMGKGTQGALWGYTEAERVTQPATEIQQGINIMVTVDKLVLHWC